MSLSSSDSDESRLSPSLGGFRWRGALSIVAAVDFSTEGCRDSMGLLGVTEWCVAVVSDWVELESVDVDSSDVKVELDDSRSELAQVYLTVLISSSNGVRKETRFSAGNMGLEVILRGTIRLLERIELRLWGCLYGIVLMLPEDSLEADVRVEEDRVEAESGVHMLAGVAVVLVMSRRSFAGGPGGGAT